MPDIKTFRAASMNEALDIVRRELGPDAVIHNTKQVRKRRFLPWKQPEVYVEVLAGVDASAKTAVSRGQASTTSPTSPFITRPERSRNRSTTPDVIFERTTTDAQVAAAGALLRDVRRHAAPSAPVAPQANALFPPELATKLDSIQQMLQQLGTNAITDRMDKVPDELFQIYTNLIDAEVEDQIAREFMSQLKAAASPEQLKDPEAALSLLTAMVEQQITCAGPIAATPGKRKVVALVGSTGVGKTTTIAKLAANFRLRDGVKMGLVTVDTYRIAAVEQLRTYAEIIDLPMKVVTSPPEMRRALQDLVGLDLILIDTAGRSPRDELQIQELKSLLAEASVDDVHLVMNLTASPKTLESTAAKFAEAGTTSVIMTKLDEAAGMGSLLSVAQKIGLPFSYLTTGQDVPDDIEPANPTRIARLILGREKLT